MAPLGTTALYMNLTETFRNGTIKDAFYTPCPLIRTVIVSKKFSVLAITLGRNASRTTANFTLVGKVVGNEVEVSDGNKSDSGFMCKCSC